MYFVFEASTGTLRALGAESGTVDGLKNSLFNHTNVPPERQILLDEQGCALENGIRISGFQNSDSRPLCLFDIRLPEVSYAELGPLPDVEDEFYEFINLDPSQFSADQFAKVAESILKYDREWFSKAKTTIQSYRLILYALDVALKNLDSVQAKYRAHLVANEDLFPEFERNFANISSLIATARQRMERLKTDYVPECMSPSKIKMIDFIELDTTNSYQKILESLEATISKVSLKIIIDSKNRLGNLLNTPIRNLTNAEKTIASLEENYEAVTENFKQQEQIYHSMERSMGQGASGTNNLRIMLHNHMEVKRFTESCFEYKKKLLLSTRRIIGEVFQRQNDLYQADVGFIQNRRRVQRIMKLSGVLKEIPRADDFGHVIEEIHSRKHFGEKYSKWHERQRVFAERVCSKERERRDELDIECPALVKFLPRSPLPNQSSNIERLTPELSSHELPHPASPSFLPPPLPWFQDSAFQTDPEPEKEDEFFDAPEFENACLQTSTVGSAEAAVETVLTKTESKALQISSSEFSVPKTSSSISSQTPSKEVDDFSGQAIPLSASFGLQFDSPKSPVSDLEVQTESSSLRSIEIQTSRPRRTESFSQTDDVESEVEILLAKKVVDAEQLAKENSEHLAMLVKLFEILEAKYHAHEDRTLSKEKELEESIEEVSTERDQFKCELDEVKSEMFQRDQKITSLELELSNQRSSVHELERTNMDLEEQLLELRQKLELNEAAKTRQNELERSYERIKIDIARVTDERDEYRSLAESLKAHQPNVGLMEQSIAIGPIWPSSPSPIPIKSHGGSGSNLMTQSCHPGLSSDSPANQSPVPEGSKDADERDHFQVGDSVLVIFNKDKKQYVLHTTGLRFYFVHEGCFDSLGLEKPDKCTDTEICLECEIAEKPVLCVTRRSKNRYNLPSHTKFYRVKVKLADD
ncbi:Oidioi.mRNA.OKI2018_I69.PAR.g11786.t1.cds [Oikopleura dioica]|uniref:Oidioi.mRNA.OKI2018_I69.PAR.g11786.t1.cds n=1 Tax=Oikopleura dioica TaxID=34765 RepID=A0ABN7S3L7_OIKDI|nr:Oidioi.mRNA.OKI2018_I69.PAR.g11786.t1.cds [Oikopleura dioica]